MNEQKEQRLRKELRTFLPELLKEVQYRESRGGGICVRFRSQKDFETAPTKCGSFAASEEDLDNLVDVFVKMFKD